jgi:hypothetical protein
MFDDLETAERKFEERKPSGDEQTSPDTSWDDTTPKDTWNNYSATGRLAVVLAGVTFCVLFFPFMSRPWGLPVATLAGYSVLVFSWAPRDENCSLGRIEVRVCYGIRQLQRSRHLAFATDPSGQGSASISFPGAPASGEQFRAHLPSV